METIERFVDLLRILKNFRDMGKPFALEDIEKMVGNDFVVGSGILEYLHLEKLIKPKRTALTCPHYVLVPKNLAKMIKVVEKALAPLKL